MVNGLHGEIEGHELTNGPEAVHGGSNGDSSKAHFCDWSIDDSLVSILFPQPSGNLICRKLEHSDNFASWNHAKESQNYFIGTIILGHFFTHDKNSFVS